MKELTDIARRVREHSGLIYRADVTVLQNIATEKAQENDELRTQIDIAEARIGELENQLQALEEHLTHVNMLADANATAVQNLQDELRIANELDEEQFEEVKDEFEGVVLGEQE